MADSQVEMIDCWPPKAKEEEKVPDSSQEDYCQCPTSDKCTLLSSKTYLKHIKSVQISDCTSCNKNDGKGYSTEPIAQSAIAKWWRSEGKNIRHRHNLQLPITTNPNTLISVLCRTLPAKTFIKNEVQRLKISLQTKKMCSAHHANILTAVATFLEKMNEPEEAALFIDEAVQLELQGENSSECKWIQERIKRQKIIHNIQKQMLSQIKDITAGGLPEPVKVEKRSATTLTVEEFHHQYALRSQPVIITDLVAHMTTVSWSMQHVRKIAGSCSAILKKLQPSSVEWARLEDGSTTTVADYIDELDNQERLCTDEKSYLFDWSIPLHCPRLAEELIVPRYFANDFLQRSSPGSLYQDSWPSLFIAPPGLRSELHVDAFGSNFWMALFEGRKRWVFFPKDENPLLYPRYEYSMDPVFEVNLAEPDFDQHPLLALTTPMECILEPGELLFVPAGCPHRVENLEKSLAISANFVDQSNVELVKQELAINALVDERADHLVKQLTSEEFDDSMNMTVTNLEWNKFKERIHCSPSAV